MPVPPSQSPPTQKASRFLLQMAGKSGTGKSTIAGPLARTFGAVTLDIDVLKSTALDIGLAWHDAGRIGYEGTWSLAESLLCQGISVIIDSPCRFERIVTEGMAIAKRQSAVYCFVECVLPDTDELRRRLRSRTRRRSQLVDLGVSSPDAPTDSTLAAQVRDQGEGALRTRYPPGPWLQVDTGKDLDRCLALAADYLTRVLGEPAAGEG
ncbi:AAA family ATPase [Actinopolymorpha sp. B11F2]|uniref:AAA family ATPase n=1 Tax=Actinopolymorpha sp. B11F2 TaxID=3160862 RepID=UPI0032E3B5AA